MLVFGVVSIEPIPVAQGDVALEKAFTEFDRLEQCQDFVRSCGICKASDILQSEARSHATCWRPVPTAEQINSVDFNAESKRGSGSGSADTTDDANVNSSNLRDSDATMEAEAAEEEAKEEDTEDLVSSDEENDKVGRKKGIMACYCRDPNRDASLTPPCLECHRLSHRNCYPNLSNHQLRCFVCVGCDTNEF